MGQERDGHLTRIELARAVVDGRAETAWDAPSRFGTAGLWARRAMRRLIQPYAVRQREVDRALLGAIAATHSNAGASIELAAPVPENAVELETDIGTLLFDAADALITPLIAKHHVWETDVVAYIRSCLEPGMTFVDVGAHAGYFSVLASQLVGEDGHVFAVEPQHRNVDLLRANLWRHGCDNVTVMPVAAHAGRGHVSLVSNPDGLAGSWIDNGHEGATLVPSAALDELLEGNRVDVLKLDIERSEPGAITGAAQLIRAAPTLDVVTEFWPGHTYAGGRTAAEVLDLYESLGLELRLLRPDGSTEPATAAQVLAAGKPSPIMNIVLQKH